MAISTVSGTIHSRHEENHALARRPVTSTRNADEVLNRGSEIKNRYVSQGRNRIEERRQKRLFGVDHEVPMLQQNQGRYELLRGIPVHEAGGHVVQEPKPQCDRDRDFREAKQQRQAQIRSPEADDETAELA